jgi:cytochrome c biogenesis protein CcdA
MAPGRDRAQGRSARRGRDAVPWLESPAWRTLTRVDDVRTVTRTGRRPVRCQRARWGRRLSVLALAVVAIAGWVVAGDGPPPAAAAGPAFAAADGPAFAAADGPALAAAEEPAPVVIRYFYGAECPHCARQGAEMDVWEQELDVEIHRYEVWHDADNRALFAQLAAAYGEEAGGVPTTFIGERVWIGFDEVAASQMREAIAACAVTGCRDPLSVLGPGPDPTVGPDDADADQAGPPGPRPTEGPPAPDVPDASGAGQATIRVPLIGDVDADAMGLLPATALIAFVDGFNPCSLWVLSVLLAMLLRTGSRRRIAAVGGAFLATTAAVYGLFIAGVFGAMSYVGYLAGIRWAVALLALAFAAVNIKDYFAFKRGFSLTIPDRYKPRIYREGRGLLDPDRSLIAVTGAAVAMALGIALVELPCTAGFPVVWSGLLTDAGVGSAEFGGLLAVYLGIYLLDEVLLFAVVVVTLRIARFQQRHGQLLKLIGGMVMLALGIVMLVRPALMSTIGGTLVVFLAAAAATTVVHLVTRRVRGASGPSGPASRSAGKPRQEPATSEVPAKVRPRVRR